MLQAVQSIVTAITTAQAALPARGPYIISEAAEGAAYTALPNPKGAVLTSVSNLVSDLNSKISTVSRRLQACSPQSAVDRSCKIPLEISFSLSW